MRPLHIKGQFGFGDAIYSRPFVKKALTVYGDVFLETCWPEVFSDLNLNFVRPQTTLRTQARNVEKQTGVYVEAPNDAQSIQLRYRPNDIARYGLMGSLRASAPWMAAYDKLHLDLPTYHMDISGRRKPVAIIRPVTVRKEWNASARNCDPTYIQHTIHELNDRGFETILLHDVDGENETFVGDKPVGAHGEMIGPPTEALISNCQHADLLVGPVGWIVPFGYASKVPTLVVHGGMASRNAPVYLSPDFHPHNYVVHITPDKYSSSERGEPDKTISNFERKLADFLAPIDWRT